MTDTKALRAMLAAATPGPWETANGRGSACVRSATANCAVYLNVRTVEVSDAVERWKADAALIVGAVNALPALLDRLEAVTKERDEARVSVAKWIKHSLECASSHALNAARTDLEASRAREAQLRKLLRLNCRHPSTFDSLPAVCTVCGSEMSDQVQP